MGAYITDDIEVEADLKTGRSIVEHNSSNAEADVFLALQICNNAKSLRGTAECNNNVIYFSTRSLCDFSSGEGV